MDSRPLRPLRGTLKRELSLDQMISVAPQVPALQDDRPQNEYFFLRQYLRWQSQSIVAMVH
jgi:hypothetical protein